MSSSEYQVTIKSANQKVDDFVTICRSNWTVHQLKQHISETHINKPGVQDQRLIYAGNILKDSQNLKQIFFRDSLCTEFSNSNKDFTIHLVCATPKLAANPASNHGQIRPVPQGTSRVSSIPSTSNSSTPNNNPTQQNTNNAALPNQSAPINISIPTAPTNLNLNTFVLQSSSPLSATQQLELQNLMRSDQMQQQMAVFQQLACMVAAQIANTVNNNHSSSGPSVVAEQVNMIPSLIPANGVPSLNVRFNTTPFNTHLSSSQMLYTENRQQTQYVPTDARGTAVHQNENVNNEPNVGVNNQQGAQFGFGAQVQAAAPAPVVEQPAARADQEILVQHDLIDWVYYSIRAAVFMAALYIHASMFRLLFIVSLLAIAYFFNRRSARRAMPARQEPQQELQVAAAPPPQDNPDLRRRNVDQIAQPVAVDNNRNNNNHNNSNNSGVETGSRNQAQEEVAAPARLPFFKLCYLVVADFLASLVPE